VFVVVVVESVSSSLEVARTTSPLRSRILCELEAKGWTKRPANITASRRATVTHGFATVTDPKRGFTRRRGVVTPAVVAKARAAFIRGVEGGRCAVCCVARHPWKTH
jgi:hypothetical protein